MRIAALQIRKEKKPRKREEPYHLLIISRRTKNARI